MSQLARILVAGNSSPTEGATAARSACADLAFSWPISTTSFQRRHRLQRLLSTDAQGAVDLATALESGRLVAVREDVASWMDYRDSE